MPFLLCGLLLLDFDRDEDAADDDDREVGALVGRPKKPMSSKSMVYPVAACGWVTVCTVL